MTSFFPVEKIQKRIVFKKNSKPVKLWESLGISTKSVILGSFIVDKKGYDEEKESVGRHSKTMTLKISPIRRNSFIDPFKEGLSFIHKVKNLSASSKKTNFYEPNEKFCQTDLLPLKFSTRTSVFSDTQKKIADAKSQENIRYEVKTADKAVSAGEPQIVKIRKFGGRNKYFRKSRNLSAWESELDFEQL